VTAEVVRFPVGINREIARLREITTESANNQLLGEGAPHPEAYAPRRCICSRRPKRLWPRARGR